MSDLEHVLDRRQLEELVGIGAISAANALGQLLGRAVQTDDPVQQTGALNAEGASGWQVAVFCDVDGGPGGWAALLVPAQTCAELAPLLCGMAEPPASMVDSVLCEMGNIAVGQAVSAMADVLGSSISTSVPELVTDAAGMSARAAKSAPGSGAPRYEAELRDRAGELRVRLVFAPASGEADCA